MYLVKHNVLIASVATGFGHYDRHRANAIQNLKRLVTCNAHSPVAVWERRNNVKCDPPKECSDTVLVHQAMTSGSGTSIGGSDVAP